jgi:tetraacyldisaccharide 4'-kinase
MKTLAAQVYNALAQTKNKLYDTEILDSVQIAKPVISVGNLTMGGTGKTPVVDLLLRHLEQKKIKTCLISRNYKSQVQAFCKIDLQQAQGAAWFGDEPWLLASKHPQTTVYVGPSKSRSLTLAHRLENADTYVVDDGFQHRAFRRNLDIVLLDASEKWENYQVIPAGRAREGFYNLARAQVVLLTKTEQATAEQLAFLRSKISEVFKGPIFEFRSKLSCPVHTEGKKIFAFSGIANAQGFEENLKEKASEFKSLRFSDHHQYSQQDMAAILASAQGFDEIITTEKDMVKIQGTPLGMRCCAMSLQFEFVEGEAEFYALVDSALS